MVYAGYGRVGMWLLVLGFLMQLFAHLGNDKE